MGALRFSGPWCSRSSKSSNGSAWMPARSPLRCPLGFPWGVAYCRRHVRKFKVARQECTGHWSSCWPCFTRCIHAPWLCSTSCDQTLPAAAESPLGVIASHAGLLLARLLWLQHEAVRGTSLSLGAQIVRRRSAMRGGSRTRNTVTSKTNSTLKPGGSRQHSNR